MVTYPNLSLHTGDKGFFVAFGYRAGTTAAVGRGGEGQPPATPELFRVTPYYPTGEAAAAGYEEKARDYRASTPGVVLDVLRRVNITEPGGDWSAFDIARVLDPGARDPERMHDTGPDTWPSPEFVTLVEETLAALDLGDGKRYVGGTSKYLYSAR